METLSDFFHTAYLQYKFWLEALDTQDTPAALAVFQITCASPAVPLLCALLCVLGRSQS